MGSKIDTQSDEAEKVVRDIRRVTRRLMLENRLLKKSVLADGESDT